MLTQKELKKILNYTKSTGIFTYKISVSRHKKGNRAGHFVRGRKYIGINYRRYNAAKLAWLYVYGEYPKGYIENINGDVLDLRIKNLKISSPEKLTYKRLKELLHYNPITGIFTWRVNICGKGGRTKRAGSKCGVGYRSIFIDKKRYSESRLAWFYMHGYLPEHDVDHINRNKADNRWINLRGVSRKCNIRNRGVSKANTSKVTGVYFNKNANKWQAYIKNDYRSIYLGIFENKDDAVKARWQAEVSYNFHNCQTTSPAYLYLKEKGLI